MTLQKWLEFGWLRPHQTSRAEILDLLSIDFAVALRRDGLGWLRTNHPELE
jgi:hypothetical protein